MRPCRSVLLLLALLCTYGCLGPGTPDAGDAEQQMQSWLDREFPEQFRVERVEVSNARATDVRHRPAYALDCVVSVRLLVDREFSRFERMTEPWLKDIEGKSGETKQTRAITFFWVKAGSGWQWSHFTGGKPTDLFGTLGAATNVRRASRTPAATPFSNRSPAPSRGCTAATAGAPIVNDPDDMAPYNPHIPRASVRITFQEPFTELPDGLTRDDILFAFEQLGTLCPDRYKRFVVRDVTSAAPKDGVRHVVLRGSESDRVSEVHLASGDAGWDIVN